MAHGYETGRLNLPFVGHCTFGKQPVCTVWDNIDADVAVLGVPYDMGTQYRSGARFGPRAIREASTLFSFGHGGAYDFEDDVVYLPKDKVRIVDGPDASTGQRKRLGPGVGLPRRPPRLLGRRMGCRPGPWRQTAVPYRIAAGTEGAQQHGDRHPR